LGVHALSPALGVRHAEEVEEERQRFGELRVEQEHGAGDLPAGCLAAVLLGDAEERPQELEDREEGNHPPVRDAVRLVDREAARTDPLDELVAEPALADPGLGDDADDPAAALYRPAERGLERRRLLLASDEAGEAARAGEVEARLERARAFELVDPDPVAEAFHAERPELLEAKEPFDQPRGVLG